MNNVTLIGEPVKPAHMEISNLIFLVIDYLFKKISSVEMRNHSPHETTPISAEKQFNVLIVNFI
jgi:hypothetical protein